MCMYDEDGKLLTEECGDCAACSLLDEDNEIENDRSYLCFLRRLFESIRS